MNYHHDIQEVFLFHHYSPANNPSNGSNARPCDTFWDPVLGRICPRYFNWVTAIPLGLALLVTLGHALRLIIPYRPRWLQPFVKEYPAVQEVPKFLHRRRVSIATIVLFILSAAGTALQGLITWHPSFAGGSLWAAMAWAVTLLLVALLRPKTAPKSLLVLYLSLSISQAVILNGPPLNSASGLQKAIPISQLAIGILAVMVVLSMPLRDPQLLKDGISAPFSTPTFELRSPEDDLALWQFLTVAWMGPLISIGSKRQINDEDVWDLGYQFQHKTLHETFRDLKGSVTGRLLVANGIDLLIGVALGLVDLGTALASPILLQQLLRAFEGPLDKHGNKGPAIVYALLTLATRLISAQVGPLNTWYARRCYERSRGEMITMLYEKTLSRKIVGAPAGEKNEVANGDAEDETDGSSPEESGAKLSWRQRLQQRITAPIRYLKRSKATVDTTSKESASMGKILNIMRNDVYEVSQRFWEFQNLVTTPISLVLTVILLWRLLGWPSLFGMLAVVVGQFLNFLFAQVLLRWERLRRKATDAKLQKVSQFVEAIRHLRWYGWQDTWREDVMVARQHELNLRVITGLWGVLIAFTNALCSGLFPVVSFWAYSSLAGLPLRVDVAFPALNLFLLLEENIRNIPTLITVLLNARVAIGRIEDFMAEPNKEEDRHDPDTKYSDETDRVNGTERSAENGNGQANGNHEDHQNAEAVTNTGKLELKNASFSWPGRSETVLENVTMSFPTGMTVICGEVGAGKSALLQGLLGELDLKDGELCRTHDMIGYCAQTPWLQSMSIRENILFSAPYEEERYKEVLEACSLVPDLVGFKHGDLSNIGENGIGLSGGQRARVALARAVYSQAKILLLDDPISALDHQTAESVIRNCLSGNVVKGRTVILVTHRTELCRGLAQQIIEVTNGRIRLVDLDDPDFIDLHPSVSHQSAAEEPTAAETAEKTTSAVPDKFIEDEHRAHGGVKFRVYWEYIKAGKLKWWFLLLLTVGSERCIAIFQRWFLKSWGEGYDNSDFMATSAWTTAAWPPLSDMPSPEENLTPWLWAYLGLAILRSTAILMTQSAMLVIVYSTGRQMFKDVMICVSHTTFRFYDVTPIGRLMNRLTSDMNTVDGNLSALFQAAVFLSLSWTTNLLVIASVTPVFLAFSLLLVSIFVFLFFRFLPTSQSLRRLEMVSLSPLMSNFGALLDGLTTVRAFCAQQRFQARVIRVVDAFQKMDHFYWSLQAWLQYRFDILSSFSTLILTLIAIYTGISPGLTAFVLTAAQTFVYNTHSLCKVYGALQMDFVAVERVVELLHLEQERDPKDSIKPPAWWPSTNGDIVFEDVTIRYAPHLDPALENISMRIPAGSSTAVIGRTGSGKSTLAMALLATVSPEHGRILIDNVDLAKVDTQVLRERVTFVAQDPVLFPGTMRQNLDPLNEYEDGECEGVLRKVGGERYGWGLGTNVEGGGRNLSQGQRQLIGLARTMLRRSGIVILDEATASIDKETAQNIQDVLHEEMKGKTVITIAHRLEAVKNADYCIVLGKGKVVKQGRAEDLLAEDSSSGVDTPALAENDD